MSKRISKNENFSVAELWKLLKRMVRIHVILEEAGESSSGIGFGRIGILDNGEIRGVWMLGGMGGVGGEGGQRGIPSDGYRESILREVLQNGKKAVKELNPAPEICSAVNEAKQRGQVPTSFLDFEGKVEYPRSDVYSLGMMIMKMFSLYSSDEFYEYEPEVKISTRRVEDALLKINTLHAKLASTLNKMMIFDCFERVSFNYLDQVINGN